MNIFAVVVMLGWIPAVLWIFSRWPAQRAMVISFLVAWMFLPQAGFVIVGIPDYTKMNATCYGIFLATAIFDLQRFKNFRPSWVDIPILVFCFSSFVSAMTNGLGPYDGFSSTLEQLATWGMPYFLGRLYLGNLSGLRDLAVAIFWGGIVYAPLCLWESRFSPQLHRIVYGFHAHDITQTFRLGGFRPTVFMYHGLMVAAWMMTATLIGFWMWRCNCFPKIFKFPFQGKVYEVKTTWLVLGLLTTFVMLRSTGTYFYLALGLLILYAGSRLRTILPLLLVMVVMCGYLYVGAAGYITGPQRQVITTAITQVVGKERAESFAFRLYNEELLGNKARKAMLFGWGGWGRNRIKDPVTGKDISVTDSLWIIVFGQNGLLGLVTMMIMFLLPVLIFCFRFGPACWGMSEVAPAAALTLGYAMFGLDCLVNAVINPVFILASGAISGLIFHAKVRKQDLHKQTRIARRQIAPRNFIS